MNLRVRKSGHIRTDLANGYKLWQLFKDAGYCYEVRVLPYWTDILWSIDGKQWREYAGKEKINRFEI